MAATVGGRMEAVAPRRSLFGPDYLRLAALAAVAVAVHLWLLGTTKVTARDGIGFARYALRLQSPHDAKPGRDFDRTALDVIQMEQHPPAYPAAVWLTAKFVRNSADLPLPESTLLAAQIVSAIAGVLLIVPTYLTGRMLFDRNAGFAAALLLQVLPVPARVTSDGMVDGLYLLAAATTIMLGVRAVRRPGVGGFLLCGLSCGASYLVRPEGLVIATAVGLVAAWLGLTRRWPRDLTLGRLAALGVGVALIAGPYMAVIGGITNKPTPNDMLPSFKSPREQLMQGGPQSRGPVVGGPVFAKAWLVPDGAGMATRLELAAAGVVQETGKSLHYAAAGLAVLGLLALRRRIPAEPGLCVLLAVAGLYFALLVKLGITGHELNGTRIYYVAEHHTLVLVWIACLLAAAALEPLAAALASLPRVGRFVPSSAPAWLLVALVVTALPTTLKPLHANREGHKHAGRWLGQVLEEHAARNEPVVVIDPFCWAEWYAGRSLYHVPEDPPDATVRYVILDSKVHDEDHARLPRMKDARAVAAGGKPVYWWPEDVPVEQAQVVVYKTVGPSERQRQRGK